jgi:hypothetical protein
MRALIALGLGLAWTAAAQVEKSTAQPVEKPPLQNTGKPMLVSYRCGEDDIRLAGLSCTIEDPCPVFLELDGVEAVGNRIFLVGNIHTSTTTLSSIVLASDDAGKSWREPHERLRASGLDRIQFIDFENGWIGGEVQHPLPRDPFLLVTSDGGQTWHTQPIFAEPQFGSIQQFSFSSRTNGSLVIDRGRGGESGRYELYETPNGGETWMLRQTNEKPIQIKRAGSANADWRLRADRPSKAYRIEHRAGDAWRGIASFLVALGGCKPPPPEAPPVEQTVPEKPGTPAQER